MLSPFEMLNRHLEVSHETFEKLKIYVELLQKWQRSINLISNDTVDDIWNRHILDSLQLIPHIPLSVKTITDLGTGAGLPGLILAIAKSYDVHLVESDTKKIAFLKEAARVTNTPVTIHHSRIEESPEIGSQLIVARALASLEELLNYSFPSVSHETICLFPKGKNYSKELEAAQKKWNFDVKTIPSVTHSDGVIVQISNIRKQGS